MRGLIVAFAFFCLHCEFNDCACIDAAVYGTCALIRLIIAFQLIVKEKLAFRINFIRYSQSKPVLR